MTTKDAIELIILAIICLAWLAPEVIRIILN